MIVSTPVDNKKNNEYYYQHSPIINSRASDIRDIKSRDSSAEPPIANDKLQQNEYMNVNEPRYDQMTKNNSQTRKGVTNNNINHA